MHLMKPLTVLQPGPDAGRAGSAVQRDRKELILTLLKARGGATLTEMAEASEISKQATSRHLEQLQTKGLVEMEIVEHAGPGRPAHRYRLTEAASSHFPVEHRALASELVDFMASTMGQEAVSLFFAKRTQGRSEQFRSQLDGLDLEQKLEMLTQLVSRQGYMAELVRLDQDTFLLRQANCPIGDLAFRYGHPCSNEVVMYSDLLDAQVERQQYMADHDPFCTYLIRRRGAQANSMTTSEIHGRVHIDQDS